MRDGTVKPDRIVSSVVPLEDWRGAFESMAKGEGVKSVICCDETIV
jgi:L-iditol 2-dehydrogenase